MALQLASRQQMSSSNPNRMKLFETPATSMGCWSPLCRERSGILRFAQNDTKSATLEVVAQVWRCTSPGAIGIAPTSPRTSRGEEDMRDQDKRRRHECHEMVSTGETVFTLTVRRLEARRRWLVLRGWIFLDLDLFGRVLP